MTTERLDDFGWSTLYEIVWRKGESRKYLSDRLRDFVRNLRAVASIVCRTILVHREKLIFLRVYVNVRLSHRGVRLVQLRRVCPAQLERLALSLKELTSLRRGEQNMNSKIVHREAEPLVA